MRKELLLKDQAKLRGEPSATDPITPVSNNGRMRAATAAKVRDAFKQSNTQKGGVKTGDRHFLIKETMKKLLLI